MTISAMRLGDYNCQVQTKDSVEVIASAIITTEDGNLIIARMKDDAPNRLAGEWHFPGTGVVQPTDQIPVVLAYYLHRALGFKVVIGDKIEAWVRNVIEPDRNRSVLHVYYYAQFAGTTAEAQKNAYPQADLSEVLIVSRGEVVELLQEGEAAWLRCHPNLFRHI